MTPDWGRGGTVSGSQKGRTDLPQSSKGRAKDGFDLHTVPDPGRQLGLDGRGGVPLVQEHYAGKVLLVPDGPAWTEWGRVFLLCPSCSSAVRLERWQVKLLLPVTSAHSLPSHWRHRPRLTYGLVDSLHAQVLHQHLPRAGLAWGSGLQRAERTHQG